MKSVCRSHLKKTKGKIMSCRKTIFSKSKVCSAVALVLTSAFSNVWADNQANILQEGERNYIDGEQFGDNLVIEAAFVGDDNDFASNQEGLNSTVRVNLFGQANQLNLEQNNAIGNIIDYEVDGVDNNVSIFQNDNNTVFASLLGSNNTFVLEQYDFSNTINLVGFVGDNNVISIQQDGFLQGLNFSASTTNSSSIFTFQIGDLNDINASIGSDQNTLLLEQDGNFNTIDISAASDFQDIISYQQGELNQLELTLNSGESSTIETSQVGDFNSISNTVNGDSFLNAINIQQTGEFNDVTSDFFSASQNTLAVQQTGNVNAISLFTQNASNNDLDLTQNGDSNFYQLDNLEGINNNIFVDQFGVSNTTTNIVSGDANLLDIVQSGEESSVGSQIAGVGNTQVVDQLGNLNLALSEIIGDDNTLVTLQDGVSNTVNTVINGNANNLGISQIGSENTVFASVFGLSENIEMTVEQDGLSNNVSSEVFAGNGHQVQVEQLGDLNEFIVQVNQTGFGDFNDISASQVGLSNIADIILDGAENIIDIEQIGNDNIISGLNNLPFMTIDGSQNSISISQSGNLNQVQGFVTGSNQTLNVTQLGGQNTVLISQTR